MIKGYQNLIVWQKSYKLVLLIYKITAKFPKIEMYGLTSQIRRSSISIPCNIAEGYRRRYTGEYLRFLSFAFGSSGELETQILISRDLKFINKEDFKKIYDLQQEVARLLSALISAIRKKIK